MSLHSWPAVITAVLAGLSLGRSIGGRLGAGGHRACHRRPAAIFAPAAVSTMAILPLLPALPVLPVLSSVLLFLDGHVDNAQWGLASAGKTHASPVGPTCR